MIRIPFRLRLKLFFFLVISVFGLVFLSCRDKAEKKSFSEVKGFDTPVQGQAIEMPKTMPHEAGAAEAPAAKLTWTLPAGWTAQPGHGMYYAVVKTSAKGDADEISIVMLAGEAGGMQANVARWLGQLGISLPENSLPGFIGKQEKVKSKGNIDVTVVDFNSLAQAPESHSMLVGVAKPGGDSYFIKLTGTKAGITKQKADFVKFCESLAIQ